MFYSEALKQAVSTRVDRNAASSSNILMQQQQHMQTDINVYSIDLSSQRLISSMRALTIVCVCVRASSLNRSQLSSTVVCCSCHHNGRRVINLNPLSVKQTYPYVIQTYSWTSLELLLDAKSKRTLNLTFLWEQKKGAFCWPFASPVGAQIGLCFTATTTLCICVRPFPGNNALSSFLRSHLFYFGARQR